MSAKSSERRLRFAAEAVALLGPNGGALSQRERYQRLRPLLMRQTLRMYAATVVGVLVAAVIAVAVGVPPLVAAIVIGAGACVFMLVSSFRTRAAILRAASGLKDSTGAQPAAYGLSPRNKT